MEIVPEASPPSPCIGLLVVLAVATWGEGRGGSKTPAFPTVRALCPDLKQTGDVAAGQPPSSAHTLVSARRHLLRRRRCV